MRSLVPLKMSVFAKKKSGGGKTRFVVTFDVTLENKKNILSKI